MNILLLQDGGEHEENKHLRECLTLRRGLLNIGHECDVWGKNHNFCSVNVVPDFDSYDAVVDLWEAYHHHLDLSFVKTKKLLWSCDAHVQGEETYTDIYSKGKYDAILSNAKGLFKNENSFWFKPWIDTKFIDKRDVDKKHFVGFCGNRNPQRNDYIMRMSKMHQMKQDIFVIGESMVRAINSYKIHFNKNLGEPHGLSYRVAETLACGTVLLTNESYMHEDLGLKHNENCLIYKTFTDINDILYNISDENIEKISESGYKLRDSFSAESRAKDLIEIINQL